MEGAGAGEVVRVPVRPGQAGEQDVPHLRVQQAVQGAPVDHRAPADAGADGQVEGRIAVPGGPPARLRRAAPLTSVSTTTGTPRRSGGIAPPGPRSSPAWAWPGATPARGSGGRASRGPKQATPTRQEPGGPPPPAGAESRRRGRAFPGEWWSQIRARARTRSGPVPTAQTNFDPPPRRPPGTACPSSYGGRRQKPFPGIEVGQVGLGRHRLRARRAGGPRGRFERSGVASGRRSSRPGGPVTRYSGAPGASRARRGRGPSIAPRSPPGAGPG